MLISCPSCPKIYRLAASAIPPGGREVRCTSCDTVWFERGVEAEPLDPPAIDLEETLIARPPAEALIDAADLIDRDGATLLDTEDAALAGTALIVAPATDPVAVAAASAPPEAPADPAPAPPPATPPGTDLAPFVERPWDVANALAASRQSIPRGRPRWRFGRRWWRPLGTEPDGVASTSTPGDMAAADLRARARRRARDRMTPLRAVAWAGWVAAVAALVTVPTVGRDRVMAMWPGAAELFVLFDAPPVRAVSLDIHGTRFAESVSGPVLEIRGTVINTGQEEILPNLALTIETADGATETAPVKVSAFAIPRGGERPFMIRAAVPLGVRKMTLDVAGDNAPRVASAAPVATSRPVGRNRGMDLR